MKTVKPIDENELMELMAGKQPAPAPAIATAPIEAEKTPQKPAPTKKKKAELYEYESYFFEQGETSARYNPQNKMYQKLKRNVHFLSGG